MNDSPFDASSGTAREREEALFDFLSEQALRPTPAAWERFASRSSTAEDAGFCALLLSNLLSVSTPTPAHVLYEVARALLEAKLTAVNFERWLQKGVVDVPRLAAHLDHALSVPS